MHHHAKVAADLAFLYCHRMQLILKSAEEADTLRSCQTVEEAHNVTSARQTAEWGMSDLKKASPRLRLHLPYKERGDRFEHVALAAHLHNFRVNRVGISQIHTTYTGYWDAQQINTFNNIYTNGI